MKKIKMISVLMMFLVNMSLAQEAKDLFNGSELMVTWIGIDYSHVKLIGGFNQFFGAGEKGGAEIRDNYFVAWNNLVLDEPGKFDIKGMLRLERLDYNTKMIRELNKKTNLSDLEAEQTSEHTAENVKTFVEGYELSTKKGVSVLFIAESLNKIAEEAYYNFVVIKNENKEILICERFRGEPSGIGLRNYWAGSLYNVIKEIKGERYKVWKSMYSKKK